MKKIIFLLLISVGAYGQVKISDYPKTTSLDTSAYVPVIMRSGSAWKNWRANKSLFGGGGTSGSSILSGDGSGGFSNVTIGTGLSFVGGTLSNTQTSATWGNITGTLSSQTDLQNALNAKQSTITFGAGVQTALGVNIGSAGAFTTFNGAHGTPSSIILTNANGLPPTTGIVGWPSNSSGFLSNDGAGNLSWGASSSGITINSTTITSGTSGRVLYNLSNKVNEVATARIWNNKTLVISNTSERAGKNEPTGQPTPIFELVNSGTDSLQQFNMKTYGTTTVTQNDMHFYRYGGTPTAPSATQSTMLLASYGYRGYGTTGPTQSSIALEFQPTENWTDAANGSNFFIQTTKNGTTLTTSGRKTVACFANNHSLQLSTLVTVATAWTPYRTTATLNIDQQNNNGDGLTNGMLLQGTSSVFSNIILGESTSDEGYVWKWGSATGANFTGTSLSENSTLMLSTNQNSKPVVIGGTPVVNLIGQTSTNMGTRLDATGFSIQNISGVHSSNTIAFLVSNNANSSTSATLSNTTAGTASRVLYSFTSDASAGSGFIQKFSSTNSSSGTALYGANDFVIGNGTAAGSFVLYNAFSTGVIKLAAGGSTATQLTLDANGFLNFASGKSMATATLNFASTAAQNSSDLTVTVTGASIGDGVILGADNASVNANTCYTAWVSATNTVTVRFNNYSSGAIDPASGTFKVIVTK